MINDVQCKALPDSGNTWETAISDLLYSKLGGQIRHLEPSHRPLVGTAKKGAKLKVLGRVRDSLEMIIKRHPARYTIKPMVVEGLSMDVNLSRDFMVENGWDQLHSKGQISIRGNKLKLEPYPVYGDRRCKIPPHTTLFVSGAVKEGAQPLAGQVAAIIYTDESSTYPSMVILKGR